jgi:CBS domain-containing protein
MPVDNYCQRGVVTAGPGDTARAAAERMDKEGVGCLVVVEGGRPVGMLTDRDLALHVLANKLDAGAVRVRELAKKPVVSVSRDASVAEATRLIRRHGVRRLPVVDEDGGLEGLLAADDLMGLVVGELNALAAAIATASRASSGEERR